MRQDVNGLLSQLDEEMQPTCMTITDKTGLVIFHCDNNNWENDFLMKDEYTIHETVKPPKFKKRDGGIYL